MATKSRSSRVKRRQSTVDSQAGSMADPPNWETLNDQQTDLAILLNALVESSFPFPVTTARTLLDMAYRIQQDATQLLSLLSEEFASPLRQPPARSGMATCLQILTGAFEMSIEAITMAGAALQAHDQALFPMPARKKCAQTGWC
ncbi:hypothetical protein [Craterilacuibacter sp.]|uniref:hypothetical protein n=1 Tax=Craterilacuibacter sp. TaxID=2870909 RepID=UPI003F3C1E4B